jgi:Domain of unknown function (DUF4114)
MADIALGQSIAGSLTSSDQKDANGIFYDEYNFKLTDNRAVTFTLEAPTNGSYTYFKIIDTAGNGNDYSRYSGESEGFQAGDYKLRVYSSTLGNYKLSTTDDGRITSFISSFPASGKDIGLVTDKGKYTPGFNLGKGNTFLFDVAFASDGLNNRLFAVGVDGFGGTSLYSVGKNLADATSGLIKDAQGSALLGNINSLAVSDENKIYTIESTGSPFRGLSQDKLLPIGSSSASTGATQDKFYTINPANNVASLIGILPAGFLSSGDLVYDATTKSFFATSVDSQNSDALWKIPLANPAGASKIGSIGFTNITGLSFDGDKLIGFNNNVIGSGSNQLSINKKSGVGTIERSLYGISDVTGASPIPTLLAAPTPTPVTPTPITPTPVTQPVAPGPKLPVAPTPVTPTPVTPPVAPGSVTPGNTQITDISLGQSITDSIASGGGSFKEYSLKGVDSFRQLNITTKSSNPSANYTVELINAATGAVLSQDTVNSSAPFSIAQTTFPGVNYKIRVSGGAKDYTLSVTGGNKATSIVSPTSATNAFISANANGIANESAVGTVDQSGAYSSLGLIAGKKLYDIARSSDGQFYGLGTGSSLYRIDPSLASIDQAKSIGSIQDTQGNVLILKGSSIDFGPGNKLYTLGATQSSLSTTQLYQIDITNNGPVATSVGTLPPYKNIESVGLTVPNEIVYDAANNRFLLATGNASAGTSDLWQIPINNPGGASKIGTINFGEVNGLEFENGQLFGFTGGTITNQGVNRIKIDTNNAVSTLDKVITGIRTLGIEGASELGDSISNQSPQPSVTPITPTPVFPTSAPNAIGTKGQSLINRMIDLTNYAGQTLKVDTVSKGDAAYTNNVGFYVVQDEIGTIKLANGNTLRPNDANYAMEAIKSAILQAGKIDSKLDRDIVGGAIYAPVVVAQGSFSDFISKNPTNGGGGNEIHAYFNYIGANTDNFDHFRLIAPNTFAVEDQYGGGDKDFNDLVVNMNVKIA